MEVTMSKQTAVEWFYKKLKNYKSLNLTDKLIQDLYKEAIQMEKEQIKDSYIEGHSIYGENTNAEQYYNETYLGIIKEEE
jgi:hypothetical protein